MATGTLTYLFNRRTCAA